VAHFSRRLRYKVGKHARQRWKERSGNYNNKDFNEIGNVIFYVNNAQLLFEYKKIRVLCYKDLVFPCAKLGSDNEFDWKVMTILTREMVQQNPQMLNSFYRPEIKKRLKKVMKIRKVIKKAGQ
jgi:hypothetical protein